MCRRTSRFQFVHIQGAALHVTHRDLHRQGLLLRSDVGSGQALPLAGQDEALTGALSPGMHRQALITGPDLHRAPPLAHLHRGAHPPPVLNF